MYSTFDSQKVDDEQTSRMDCVRLAFKILLGEIMASCPPGRERSECVTNLEYACMRAIRAITHTPQLEANGQQLDPRCIPPAPTLPEADRCCKAEETGPCPN